MKDPWACEVWKAKAKSGNHSQSRSNHLTLQTNKEGEESNSSCIPYTNLWRTNQWLLAQIMKEDWHILDIFLFSNGMVQDKRLRILYISLMLFVDVNLFWYIVLTVPTRSYIINIFLFIVLLSNIQNLPWPPKK
jgi:hypothetical protein